MKPLEVPLDAVVPLPPEVATIRQLRNFMGIEAMQRDHPEHELFIVAFRTLPDNPFAILMRIRKDVVHIQDRWPLPVDRETRVVVVYPPGQVPLGEGRVG